MGNNLAELEMKNESDAESLICIALDVTKKSSKKDNSIHSFLNTVDEYNKSNQLPDIKVISSVYFSISLHLR